MKTIQLTQGFEAIVDDDVYEEVCQHKWCAHVNMGTATYGFSSTYGMLHRFIYELYYGQGSSDGLYIDHINRNGLDDRKENIRLVTRAENSRNRIDRQGSSNSPYTGVAWKEHAGRWRSQYWKDGKTLALGYFDTPEEAGMAHDRAVLYFEGDSGVLNFPDKKDAHNLNFWKSDTRQKLRKNNPTGYRGVHRKAGKFAASIGTGGRSGHKEHLGTFDTPEDAARAYDKRFIELNGYDSVYLNFPEYGE